MSAYPARETQAYLTEFQAQRDWFRSVVPAGFDTPLPVVIILDPQVQLTRGLVGRVGAEVLRLLAVDVIGDDRCTIVAQPLRGIGDFQPWFQYLPVAFSPQHPTPPDVSGWPVDLLRDVMRDMQFNGDHLAVRIRPVLRSRVPEIAMLFSRSDAAAPGAARPSPVLREQRRAFAAWALPGGGVRARAYWEFARRSAKEPVTAALFKQCFGVSYADMHAELRRSERAQEVVIPIDLDKTRIALREATSEEVDRFIGAYDRLVTERARRRAAIAARFKPLESDRPAAAASPAPADAESTAIGQPEEGAVQPVGPHPPQSLERPSMSDRSRVRPSPRVAQLRPNPARVPRGMSREGEWVFELLPKSLQLNPRLEMSVATHFTPYGRTFPPVSPEHPAYYALENGGFHERGQFYGTHSPAPARIDAEIRRALAENGHLLAPDGRRPDIAVFVSWGAHNQETPVRLEMTGRDGESMGEVPIFNDRARVQGSVERMRLVRGGLGPVTDRFKTVLLSDLAGGDIYFVVASAYDYSALARGERRLMWRTYMTVDARGVSMNESVMPLIANAAPFFGRDMTEPAVLTTKISRFGRVEIGPMQVIEEDVRLARPPKSD